VRSAGARCMLAAASERTRRVFGSEISSCTIRYSKA
jgi:hypothetical protein